MAWIYLAVAGILEVVWAFFMKKSEGFSLLKPSGRLRMAIDNRAKLPIIVTMVMTLGK
ncbi:MAG: hypothetical protein EAS49_09895, partial [Brucella intermedia]